MDKGTKADGNASGEGPCAYCVDVSGSVGAREIGCAIDSLKGRLRTIDKVIAFSDEAVEVDVATLADLYLAQSRIGRGTQARVALDLAKKLGCVKTVLLSDGFMPEKDLRQFDEFIEICCRPGEYEMSELDVSKLAHRLMP